MAPPILFLHGWTMHGAIFDDVMARLGAGFDCTAPDLPGHGKAAGLAPSLDAMADRIAEILDQFTGVRPLIVGWSMGAAAAWHYGRRCGWDRIGGLVTIDMSPAILPAPDWPHGLKGQTAESVAASTRRFAANWDGATYGIAATMFGSKDGAPGFSREDARKIIRSHDPDLMRSLWDDLLASDARDIIPSITIPYLVCSGSLSRVYPASASAWIIENAPNARQHVFTRSGHSPHLEEPAEFVKVIGDFAKALARR